MTFHFLYDVANDTESHKGQNYFIILSLKSETMGKLIKRIPGIVKFTSLAMSTSILKALPDKLDIKRHSPGILYIQI